MDSVSIARGLAAQHPAARLPCPVCANTVNADHLDKHLEKVHADTSTPTAPWRGKGFLGLMPCSLALEGDVLAFRYALGLATRRIPLTGALVIETGALWGSRPDAGMSSYADDMNVPHERVRTGSYLRLVGPGTITIGWTGG